MEVGEMGKGLKSLNSKHIMQAGSRMLIVRDPLGHLRTRRLHHMVFQTQAP